ncbi:acetyl-CoA hydrolase/transferase [Kipferlia bialata]|uniref:Acetyl-CoA hydrolase n=1 Tax=Kipferlia bialata TaxID=797122 RepID=A0A9K3D2D0_9EUKA|nr:acetyl-CoA hydrolase/transferase [Kipferlia bialata]|eukprot:g8910.t1
MMNQRIRNAAVAAKVCTPESLIHHFKDGMKIGVSGFTPAGYPKMMPKTLADHVEENELQGQMSFTLCSGASIGADFDNRWASLGMTRARFPYQTGKDINTAINKGECMMSDRHLSMFPQNLMYGFYNLHDKAPEGQATPFDIGIVEATAIREDGSIVLGSSCGISPEVVKGCKKLIIEVNTSIPSFEGIHDIYTVDNPPNRVPIPLTSVDQRIGELGIQVDPSKIIGVIESRLPDKGRALAEPDQGSKDIAENILEFLYHERNMGRQPESLHPLQSGVGSIANAVVAGLATGDFDGCEVWTEVLQDSVLDVIDAGKLKSCSATSLSLSEPGFERFFKNWDRYFPKCHLRPSSISNHPEVIRRLGVTAMNTPIEVDIYGHANSSHLMGARLVNGIGGSGDFLRNAKLSMMHFPSTRPSKTDPFGISSVVPMVSHVDHPESDLDVLVSEQGLADLRGLGPKQRARQIIMNCAHPKYRDMLMDYVRMCERTIGFHEPQDLHKALGMHLALSDKGSMRDFDLYE